LLPEIVKTNKKLNDEEIRQRKTKLDSFMRSLIVTLSSHCNLSCIMCEVKRVKWDIPQRAIEEIIELFPYLESVSWQGGEPFLLGYFEDIFDQATRFDLKQTIVTNGILINEKWAEKLVKNNVELTFSIDGITKEVYEHIRERAKFEDVIRSLKIIREAKHKCDSRRMTLRLHAVIMKSNYHLLEEFVDFAKEYEFQALHLMPVQGEVAGIENVFSPPDMNVIRHISAMKKTIEEKAKKYNLLLLNALPEEIGHKDEQIPPSLEGQDGQPLCQMPWQQLNIDPGGGVRPGCLCLKTVGSILENRIMDIWNNDAMQSYRKGIIEQDFKPICNPSCISLQRLELVRQNNKNE